MRRLILPVLILAVAIAGLVMSTRADNTADPGLATSTNDGPSLGSPILSARRAPAWLKQPKSDALLGDAVSAVLRGAPADTCVLVERDGVPIAANNNGSPIRPASLQRLLTITALDAIGSDVGYRTEVAMRSDAPIDEDGVLDGDLWLIGSGDPVLATTPYVSRFGDNRVFTDFALLAADTVTALQSLGITSIRGRVIGDQTKYGGKEYDYVGDDAKDMEGNDSVVWTREDAADNLIGPLSALQLNAGFDGWDETDPDPTLNTRSSDPSISAADILDDFLEEAGISVRRSPRDEEAPLLSERRTLATIDSPPLSAILDRALDDATVAEMLLKEFGVRSGQGGERERAVFTLSVLGGFSSAGLPFQLSTTRYHDGSGRSDLNRTTCDMVHATIATPDNAVALIAPSIADSPVSRCAPATDGELSVVAAVSDTTTGLTGEFVAENGDRITFVLMVDEPDRLLVDPDEQAAEGEDPPEPPEPYDYCNSIQAAMLDAIAGHPYGPALDDLAPLNPASG